MEVISDKFSIFKNFSHLSIKNVSIACFIENITTVAVDKYKTTSVLVALIKAVLIGSKKLSEHFTEMGTTRRNVISPFLEIFSVPLFYFVLLMPSIAHLQKLYYQVHKLEKN